MVKDLNLQTGGETGGERFKFSQLQPRYYLAS